MQGAALRIMFVVVRCVDLGVSQGGAWGQEQWKSIHLGGSGQCYLLAGKEVIQNLKTVAAILVSILALALGFSVVGM